MKPVIIMSAFKGECGLENLHRHEELKDVLKTKGVGFKETYGVYKGEVELGVVVDAKHEGLIQELCQDFEQEYYLYVGYKRDMLLVYPNKTELIGVMKASRYKPDTDYVFRADLNTYYYAN